MIDWYIEKPKIVLAAQAAGVDPAFVLAIRRIEDDRESGDFGIDLSKAPTWSSQLSSALATIQALLCSYPLNPLCKAPSNRLVYSQQWIAYFAANFAPTGGVNNHPHYNANWYPQFLLLYQDEISKL